MPRFVAAHSDAAAVTVNFEYPDDVHLHTSQLDLIVKIYSQELYNYSHRERFAHLPRLLSKSRRLCLATPDRFLLSSRIPSEFVRYLGYRRLHDHLLQIILYIVLTSYQDLPPKADASVLRPLTGFC
jgi:hypothetical protein